jgi:hypothetical protein
MFLPIFSSPDIGTRFSVLASAFTYCGAISLQPRCESKPTSVSSQ